MRSSLTRRILLSWGSSVLTTVVGFIGTIYLARTLGAAPLGIFSLCVSIMGWLRVSDLGVTQATVKRISEGENQAEFISASLIIQMIQTAVVVAGLLSLREPVNDYIGGEFAIIVAGLFVINRLVNGTARQVLSGYRAVHLSHGLSAFDRTLRSVLQVALVATGFEVIGLFLGMGAAFVITGTIAVVTVYSVVDLELALPDLSIFESLLGYAKYSVLSVVKSEAFSWTDIIVMGFFVENTVIGVYNVSWSIAMAFLLFGNAMQQNLFPEISGLSSAGSGGKARNLISESLVYAGVFPIAGVVGSFVVGDSVLSVYGTEFTDGHYVLVVLIFVSLLRAYEKQIHAVLDGINRPDITFRLNALFTAANICLNVLLVPLYGAVGAAIATSCALALNIVFGWYLSSTLVGGQFPLAEIGKQIVAAIAMGVTVVAVKGVLPPEGIVALLVVVGIGAAVYFGILMLLSKEIRAKVQTLVDQQLAQRV